jgi:hypothetical protein
MGNRVAMSDLWVGVLLALAAGLGGVVINTAVVHREQNRAHWREQQRKDSETLGPVLVYLTNSHPTRLAANKPSDAKEVSRTLRVLGERRDRLRENVATLGAGHPDPVAARLARELEVALHNALVSAAWVLHDVGDADTLAHANADHDLARTLTDDLIEQSARYGRRTDETWLARVRRRS